MAIAPSGGIGTHLFFSKERIQKKKLFDGWMFAMKGDAQQLSQRTERNLKF